MLVIRGFYLALAPRPIPLWISMAVHVPVISKASTHEDFPKLGVPVWGAHNKDYSTLGSILGSSFWETTTFILEAQRKY